MPTSPASLRRSPSFVLAVTRVYARILFPPRRQDQSTASGYKANERCHKERYYHDMLLLPVVPFALALCFKSYVWAGPVRRAVGGKILFEGRAPLNLTEADLDASKGPFSTYVITCYIVPYIALTPEFQRSQRKSKS